MLAMAVSSRVKVTRYENYNQALNVIVRKGVSKGGTVSYLGANATDEGTCQDACESNDVRCWSYVFLLDSKECYGVTSPGFNPSYDTNAVSGVLHWACRSNEDCSLNGRCEEHGGCSCRPAWTGDRCQTLSIQPTPKSAGYNGVDNGNHTSSWGGAVLRGNDNRFHMFAAEMTEHCGIGAWSQNSRVIHATSTSPSGPYTRQNVVWEVFSHEPEVVPGPNGEFVMYFTAQLRSPHGLCDCCRQGDDPCDGSTGPNDCPSNPLGDSDGSFMSWAPANSTGDERWDWSSPQPLFPDYVGSDTNFAPIILQNGSLVALWREWTERGSRQYVATATDWKNMSTYEQHTDRQEIFPDLGAAGVEDQFLYQDDEGYFHAVFHHMYGTGTSTQWWLDPTGGHAYSKDGWTWTYTGVAWGNATARYNTPADQGGEVVFADGSTERFTRLERPHLILKSSSFEEGARLRGEPTFLINSAQYGMGTDPGASAQHDDACYTIIRPIGSS